MSADYWDWWRRYPYRPTSEYNEMAHRAERGRPGSALLEALHAAARGIGAHIELSVRAGKPLGEPPQTHRLLHRLIIAREFEPLVIVDVARAGGLEPAARQAFAQLQGLRPA